jgi:hypothetical protein
MELNKYINDGWGLSKKEFEILLDELLSINPSIDIYNIVEFGSGRSTEFLVDFINNYALNIKIYSFDDSKEYAFNGTHQNLDLYIVPLIECSDFSWMSMFMDKKYNKNLFTMKTTPTHTRQKNTFYSIEDYMLPEKIDLVILDGSHGNGRSIGFLRCLNRLKIGSKILIDDASHYPFYDDLNKLYNTKILYKQNIKDDKWNNGGDFILCEIIE